MQNAIPLTPYVPVRGSISMGIIRWSCRIASCRVSLDPWGREMRAMVVAWYCRGMKPRLPSVW